MKWKGLLLPYIELSITVHNEVLVPTLLYGSETWVLQKKNERKTNATTAKLGTLNE